MAITPLRLLGDRGERRARRYLKRSGYKILERNFKNPFGEVDIIAKKGDVVAFIEVKTRSSDLFGMPSEAVLRDKKRRYVRAAEFYFANRQIDVVVRFDVIEVYRGKVNHILSAFEA